MKVLLDVNVVLDLLLNRTPWAADAALLWDAHLNKKIDAHLAAFTFPTIYYIVRRQADLATAQTAVERCLLTLAVAPTDRNTLELARRQAGGDFEDNLQIACAVNAGLQAIITRDATGFAHSPLPVLSPAAAVARLGGPPTP